MKLSIIVPVYNVAAYLRDCLNSVRAQTCKDWQCICIDDGSTDESNEILNEFQNLDSRFVVIYQQNQGVSAARNAGLKVATGDWMGFLDGDDILSPFAVEVCCKIIREHENLDVVAFGLKSFDKDTIKWERPLTINTEIVDMRAQYPSRQETETSFSGKFYRRHVLSENPFPSYHNGEDIVFLFASLLKVNFMGITSLPLYGYRQRNDSASKNCIQKRRLLDYHDYTTEIWHMLNNAKKKIDVRIFRRNIIDITEGMMRMIVLCRLSSRERSHIWNRWVASLREVMQSERIMGFQRFRLKLFLLFPFYGMAWFLFYIPIWLKVHGVHR